MRNPCLVAIAFVLALVAPVSGDDGADAGEKDGGGNVAARVPKVMEGLRSGDDGLRSKAAKDLADLGTDAIGRVLQHLPPDSDFDAWDGLADAFTEMGVEDALGELLSHRPYWPDARRDTLAGFEWVLRDRLPERGTYTVRLRAAALSSPSLVPLPLCFPVIDGLPLAEGLAPGRHLARIHDGVLEFDSTGNGRSDLTVKKSKPGFAEVGPKGSRRKLVFFHRLGRWYAGPASALHGTSFGKRVELLDGDLDGRFDGEADYLRVGDGAFQRHTSDRLLATHSDLMKYRLVTGGNAPVLELRAEPMPPWATPEHREALQWLNRWRADCGLPALLLDRRRSEACELHSRYMAPNGLVHEEATGREGYTTAGNRAGRSSSLSPDSDPTAALRTIASTILHRNTCVGRRSEGLGLGFRGGGGSVMWGGSSAGPELGHPVVVPGPGQRNVPRSCRPEMPRPDMDARFYEHPRGYPVSVSFGRLYREVSEIRLEVFMEGDAEPVDGFVFSPETPYSMSRPRNYSTAYFVAAEAFVRRTTYVARFSAQADGKPVEYVWSFSIR